MKLTTKDILILKLKSDIKKQYGIKEAIELFINIDLDLETITSKDIYFFICNNKKYILKDNFLAHTIQGTYTKNSETKSVSQKKKRELLFDFFRNEINKHSYIFPKLLEETEDFFIFEYLNGDMVEDITTINQLTSIKIFDKLKLFYSNYSGKIRPSLNIEYNWILTEDGYKFFDMDSFVVDTKQRMTLVFESTETQISADGTFFPKLDNLINLEKKDLITKEDLATKLKKYQKKKK